MAISMYQVYVSEQREAAHAAYMADPAYPALEAEAKSKGFRKATLAEVNASAERSLNAPELYSWRGGLWTPIN